MTLTLGTRLGVYDVTAPIGEGGMGQVYRLWSDKPLADIVAAGIPTFDLAPDGKRVAALMPVETPGQSHVTFLLNFGDELQRKMPVRK